MLVIFDCDGVLVDSEALAAEIFSEVLAKFNILFSPEQCFRQFHGKTLADCYLWLEKKFNTTLSPTFDEVLRVETARQFSLKLKPVEGVDRVLQTLKQKNIPFCVASNGGHEKISHSLSITHLDAFFKHRFSADDVVFGKPHPDLFLFAAEQMGALPQDCVVIEDSDSGVRAAHAAKMEVLKYVPTTEQPTALSEALMEENAGKNEEEKTAQFATMDELLRILGVA